MFNWPYINIYKWVFGNQSIQHRNYETIKNNFHQTVIIFSHLLYQSVQLRRFIHFIFIYTAHFKYDITVYHKSESVTLFMHK